MRYLGEIAIASIFIFYQPLGERFWQILHSHLRSTEEPTETTWRTCHLSPIVMRILDWGWVLLRNLAQDRGLELQRSVALTHCANTRLGVKSEYMFLTDHMCNT